jgi:hypothetical protein
LAHAKHARRHHHQDNEERHLSGNAALVPLVDAGLKQFLEKRVHRMLSLAFRPTGVERTRLVGEISYCPKLRFPQRASR